MSVLLFIVGAIAAVLGIGMVGYGIPVQEFSFGNTLIVAGTTLAAGGLIVIAIGVAVTELKRITETLASGTPARRPVDMFEPRTTASGIPFQSRPGTAGAPAPMPASSASDEAAAVAPMLRNPERPKSHEVKEYEDISLSPHEPAPAAQPEQLPSGHESPVAEKRPEPLPEPPWRSPPPERQQEWPSTSFEAMWPAPSKRAPAEEARAEPQSELARAQPATTENHPQRDPEVAILKSGVVDGMGYTLYVDGSIEAELPQGTLRFASINELREHLAKHS